MLRGCVPNPACPTASSWGAAVILGVSVPEATMSVKLVVAPPQSGLFITDCSLNLMWCITSGRSARCFCHYTHSCINQVDAPLQLHMLLLLLLLDSQATVMLDCATGLSQLLFSSFRVAEAACAHMCHCGCACLVCS